MKTFITFILICIFTGFSILSCYDDTSQPSGELVDYSDCKRNFSNLVDDKTPPDQDCVKYTYDCTGTLILKHLNAGFNCCPDEIIAVTTITDNTIHIKESEMGGYCRCECLYDLDYKITNLPPGIYKIIIDEPLANEDDQQLAFDMDLTSSTSDSYCVGRTYYPWLTADDFCIDHKDCSTDSYCMKPSGDCDGQGQCTSKPDMCTEEYAPVCGCDGKTYGNECFAASEGVNVSYTGECNQLLNLTTAVWTTKTEKTGDLIIGSVDLYLQGSTTGYKVTVKTYGDGLIADYPLTLSADSTFDETVPIKFTHQPDSKPFTLNTVVTAYDENGKSKSTELNSGKLSYKIN